MNRLKLLKAVIALAAILAILLSGAWLYLNSAGLRARIDDRIRSEASGRGVAVAAKLDRISPRGALSFGSIDASLEGMGFLSLKECGVTGALGYIVFGRRSFRIDCREGRQEFRLSSNTIFERKTGDRQRGTGVATVVFEVPDYEVSLDGHKVRGELRVSYINGRIEARMGDPSWGAVSIENLNQARRTLDVVFEDVRTEPFLASFKPGLEKAFSAAVGGRVTVAVSGGFVGVFAQDLKLTDVSLLHQIIGSAPFRIPGISVSCSGTLSTGLDSGEIKGCNIGIGGMAFRLGGVFGQGAFRLGVAADSLELNALAALLGGPELEGFDLEGGMGFKAAVEGDLKPRVAITAVSLDGNVGKLVQRSDRLDYLKHDFSYEFTDDKGGARTVEIGSGNRDYVTLESLPRHMIGSVIVSEDAGFFGHKGIEFKEIESAMVDNLINGKPYLRGGSTITQQLVKNLFLGRDKNLLRKLKEVLLALEIEATLPKWRILGIYLNGIEWGPGTFGIGAASKLYFGKPATSLLPHEAAYLASIIPNPNRYYIYFAKDNLREDWYDRLRDILGKLNYFGYLDDEDLAKYKDAKIVYDRYREGAQPPVPPPEAVPEEGVE
jgi:hypothetical protein